MIKESSWNLSPNEIFLLNNLMGNITLVTFKLHELILTCTIDKTKELIIGVIRKENFKLKNQYQLFLKLFWFKLLLFNDTLCTFNYNMSFKFCIIYIL